MATPGHGSPDSEPYFLLSQRKHETIHQIKDISNFVDMNLRSSYQTCPPDFLPDEPLNLFHRAAEIDHLGGGGTTWMDSALPHQICLLSKTRQKKRLRKSSL